LLKADIPTAIITIEEPADSIAILEGESTVRGNNNLSGQEDYQLQEAANSLLDRLRLRVVSSNPTSIDQDLKEKSRKKFIPGKDGPSAFESSRMSGVSELPNHL